MSLLQLTQLADIVGVIAVIGSLVYVGVQLRQNTTALHAQSRQSVLTASQAELLGGVSVTGATLLATKETGLTREENMILNRGGTDSNSDPFLDAPRPQLVAETW